MLQSTSLRNFAEESREKQVYIKETVPINILKAERKFQIECSVIRAFSTNRSMFSPPLKVIFKGQPLQFTLLSCGTLVWRWHQNDTF